jgi:hypothetical protein
VTRIRRLDVHKIDDLSRSPSDIMLEAPRLRGFFGVARSQTVRAIYGMAWPCWENARVTRRIAGRALDSRMPKESVMNP